MRIRAKLTTLAFLFLLTAIGRWSAREPQRTPSPNAPTATFTGSCVVVHDGDTITVEDASRTRHRIRVFGIDAPEQDQPHGRASRSIAKSLILGARVEVETVEVDRYGRPVAQVTLDNGQDFATELIRRGAAWHYRRYSSDDRHARAQTEARSSRRGLWASGQPVPPWEWRSRSRGD